MSHFNLRKKLQPAKNVWMKFSAAFQSKLHKLKLRKAFKGAKKHCVIAFNYIRPFISRKLYYLIQRKYSKRHSQRQFYHHMKQNHFPPIYVDKLFPKPSISSSTWYQSTQVQPKHNNKLKMESSSSSNNGGGVKVDGESSNNNNTINGGVGDRWRVPSLPHFKGVDERAEEFISKFRKEMKLEREQSILDFQEMLARGS